MAAQISLASKIVNIAVTSDIHGWVSTKYIYPGKKASGLLHIADAIHSLRKKNPELILLDSGDLLSGSPLQFYYNHVQKDPLNNNVFFNLLTQLKYDAITVGNHDLDIYRQLKHSYFPKSRFKWLAANLYENGKTPFLPYIILRRNQLSIAIFGLTTPGSLMWNQLSRNSNIEIQSIKSALHYWISHIRQTQSPDLIIGLFHVGLNSFWDDENSKIKGIPPANELREALKETNDLDLIISGHDHRLNPYRSGQKIRYIQGVPTVSPGYGGKVVLHLQLRVNRIGSDWTVTHIVTVPIKADTNSHSEQVYSQMLSGRYKSYIQAKLPWKIGKTTNKQASICFNQLMAIAHSSSSKHGSLFPYTKIKRIRNQRGKYLRRADLFRWFRYHNRSVTVKLSKRDIYLLNHPQREFGKWKVAYNRKLFFWSKKPLDYKEADSFWWPDSDVFDRRIKFGLSDYHAHGGGGVVPGLFIHDEMIEAEKGQFLKERLFKYLSTSKDPLPDNCGFLARQ